MPKKPICGPHEAIKKLIAEMDTIRIGARCIATAMSQRLDDLHNGEDVDLSVVIEDCETLLRQARKLKILNRTVW